MFSSGAVATATASRWTTMATSAALHVAFLLVVVYTGGVADVLPDKTPRSRPMTFVRVAPPDPPWVAPPPVRLPPVARETVKSEPILPAPEIEKPPVPERVVARVQPPRPAPEARPESAVSLDRPSPAPPLVQMGRFDASPSSTQAVRPSQRVQQAEFDTAVARAPDTATASAVVGAFERPAADGRPRAGDGRLNEVANAGFGTGRATGPVAGNGAGRVVATGGLDVGTGDGGGGRAPQAVKATDFDKRITQRVATKAPSAAPTEVPIEILSKPTPEYTDEARALKIEGEVAIEVEFTATGDIRVISVVRGLGHGLDESAARAVRGMRFRPATRNGQTIDVRTMVNIVFRLA